MIITVDTSAFIVVLRNQPEARRYAQAMLTARGVLVSAATYVETGIVADAATPAHGKPAVNPADGFDELLREVNAEIVPVNAEMARLARIAYRRYGRGSGHPAKLNYGDCFSYALATLRGTPLLFKGSDFIHTDVAII